MSIPVLSGKIKSFMDSEKGKDVFIFVVIVCVAISSFVLGKLSVAQKNTNNPIVVKFDPSITDYFYEEQKGGEVATPTLSTKSLSEVSSNTSLSPSDEEVAGEISVSEDDDTTNTESSEEKGDIVASSRGSKYYYVYCSGAKTLSESNKIYFSSEEEAESNGYSLSTSCTKK